MLRLVLLNKSNQKRIRLLDDDSMTHPLRKFPKKQIG